MTEGESLSRSQRTFFYGEKLEFSNKVGGKKEEETYSVHSKRLESSKAVRQS